ncbi:MAG: hypothetical protein ACT6Q7_02870 [Blastomonas fulva]|uniref:hypothetical protein n=1 Tax=Blastomonas fulva TaxID=1550728 RepID=UPI0040331CA6
MSDTALAKVEDALKALFEAYAPLDGVTFHTARSSDEAFDEEDLEAGAQVLILTESFEMAHDESQGQTQVDASLICEVIEISSSAGVVTRNAQEIIAHMIAAIHTDRTLGGRLEDLEEQNVAPSGRNGIDASACSLLLDVVFYTPRGDLFTIVGPGGSNF